MAGIWDRIIPSSNDRLAVHLVKAAIYLRGRNVFTSNQILNGLNSQLTTPLDANAQTDLTNIITQATTGSATAKLDYLERLDAMNVAVEDGLLTNEATWRSELGIA